MPEGEREMGVKGDLSVGGARQPSPREMTRRDCLQGVIKAALLFVRLCGA